MTVLGKKVSFLILLERLLGEIEIGSIYPMVTNHSRLIWVELIRCSRNLMPQMRSLSAILYIQVISGLLLKQESWRLYNVSVYVCLNHFLFIVIPFRVCNDWLRLTSSLVSSLRLPS